MSLEELVRRAARRREAFIPEDTNVYRLFDGAGDGRPGWVIEKFANRWLVVGGDVPGDWGWGSLWRQDARPGAEPEFIAGDSEPTFLARENGAVFEVSFAAGSSQGLFPDQRLNRLECARRSSKGGRVLNLFSYTCGFSVMAAREGATTTSVDASGRYLDWGKRNFECNGLDPSQHHWVKGDAAEWLRVFLKKGRLFDGIILDPPTFGRSGNKEFRIERDLGGLLDTALKLLDKGGWLLCCSNCRRMGDGRFGEILRAVSRRAKVEFAEMPPEYRDAPYLKSAWLEV